MYRTLNPFKGCEVPCALKPYVNEDANGKVCRSFSQLACGSSFFNWVQTTRLASDIDAEEVLMCPMSRCRKSFNDTDATVRHVLKCPHLFDGQYWCLHCKRLECFLEGDKGSDKVPKPRPQKWDKRLAVAFFQRLFPIGSFRTTRNQSDPAEIASHDVSRSELLRSQRAIRLSLQGMLGSSGCSTMDGASDTVYDGAHNPQASVSEFTSGDPVYFRSELPDRTSVVVFGAGNPTSSNNWNDLQADSSHGRACLDPEIECNNPVKDLNFLDDKSASSSFYTPSEENVDASSSMPSLQHDFAVPQTTTPSSPNSSRNSQLFSVLSSGSSASSLGSPMSNVDFQASWSRGVPNFSTAAHIEDSNNAWRPLTSGLAPPESDQSYLRIPLARPRANTAPASDSISYYDHPSSERRETSFQLQCLGADANSDHRTYLGGPPTGTRVQVERLLDLVVIIRKKWIEGLIPGHELHRRCSSQSTRDLFFQGITTLKTWFNHIKSEYTFEEVFSFMLIALAAACLAYPEDESCCWDAFFQDALQLQHTLVNEEEKLLFVRAISRWQWLPGQQISYSNTTPHASIIQNTFQKESTGSDPAEFFQKVRNSKAFKACVELLDGFEEALTMERKEIFPGAQLAAKYDRSKISAMIEKIILPLRHKKGIEAFHPNLTDASSRVLSGNLLEEREVEVVLVSSAQWSSQPREVFERFQSYLTAQCNTIKNSPDGRWRDVHYIADLNDMTKIFDQLDREQGPDSASKLFAGSKVLATVRSSEGALGSPTSPSSRITGVFTVGSSPTNLTIPELMDEFKDNEVSTRVTSPSIPSPAVVSPTSSALNTSSSKVILPCECGETFSGRLSFARSNLKRHLKTSPIHNEDAGVKCPEPGCPTKISRDDNMASHLIRKHKIIDPQELDQAIKKSKRGDSSSESA